MRKTRITENERPLGPVEFMNAAFTALLVGLVILAGGIGISIVFSLEPVAR